MGRPFRTKSIPERVEDLEEDIHGNPNNPDDEGLAGQVKFLRNRERERDGVLKAIRIAAMLLGIAVGLVALGVRLNGGG